MQFTQIWLHILILPSENNMSCNILATSSLHILKAHKNNLPKHAIHAKHTT